MPMRHHMPVRHNCSIPDMSSSIPISSVPGGRAPGLIAAMTVRLYDPALRGSCLT